MKAVHPAAAAVIAFVSRTSLTIRRVLATTLMLALAVTTWVCKAAHLGAHWVSAFHAACQHHGAVTVGLHFAVLAVVTATECYALRELAQLVRRLHRGRDRAGCFEVALEIFATILRAAYLILGWRALTGADCLGSLDAAAEMERLAATVLLMLVTMIDAHELTHFVRHRLRLAGPRTKVAHHTH